MKTRPQIHKCQLIFVMLLMFSNLFACVGASVTGNSDTQAETTAIRIIIGFDSADINPQDRDIIKEISHRLGIEMEFVGKLSGNAAVYSARSHLSEEHLNAELEQLKSITYIRYAELDRRRQIQTR